MIHLTDAATDSEILVDPKNICTLKQVNEKTTSVEMRSGKVWNVFGKRAEIGEQVKLAEKHRWEMIWKQFDTFAGAKVDIVNNIEGD